MADHGTWNQGHTYEQELGRDVAGSTLLDWLCQAWRHSDRATWHARIQAGEVWLDGEPASAVTPLRPGMLFQWHRPPWQEPDVPLDAPVLFEDEHILAVAKPSGLPTLPGAGFHEHTLLKVVQRHRPEASPMHRLGRATSGVVLFTCTPTARRRIQTQWAARQVRKVYRALASGLPAHDAFDIDQPIGRVADPVLGTLFAATPDGRDAASQVVVLDRRVDESLWEVRIHTGRPHQIRIHAAYAGHPLVGDPLYGPGGGRRPGSTAVPGDGGYHLHALSLGFEHPIDRTPLTVTAQPPPILRMAGEVDPAPWDRVWR